MGFLSKILGVIGLSGLLFFASEVAACPTQADLRELGSEPGAALADCVELASFEIPTGRGPVNAKIFGDTSVNPDTLSQMQRDLIRAGNALARMGRLSSAPIEVYLSPTPYVPDADGGDAVAVAAPSVDVGPGNPATCIFAVFTGEPLDFYAYVLAHEFFHCMQYFEFPRQMDMDAERTAWWTEASAEWFATFVFQGSSEADYYVAEFDSASPETPITSLSYSNIVFFWWLSQNYGLGSVTDLISQMPTTASGSQEDALAGVINDQEFLAFVRDYLDGNIVQPGGRMIASVPLPGLRLAPRRGGRPTLSAPRFVVYRALISFDCGEWFVRELNKNGLYQVQRQPDWTWAELPPVVASDTGDDVDFKLAGGATTPEGFLLTFEAEKDPCTPCVTPDFTEGPAACLVGDWHLVSGGTGERIGRMLERIPDMQNIDYPDIDGFLTLTADGRFTLRADDSGSMETVTPDGKVFSADIQFTMERRGTWSLDRDRFEQCYVWDMDIHINETVTNPEGNSETLTANRFLGASMSYETRRRFTCSDGRLEITERAFFAPTIHWVYEK